MVLVAAAAFTASVAAEDIDFTVPADWSLRALADLDGDGRDELIWSSPVASPPGSRDFHALFTDEDGNEDQTVTFYQATGSAWTLAGTADFDGDGKDDLFWRNLGNGRAGLFLMDGTSPSWRNVVLPGGAFAIIDSSWTAAALGDLDGDGEAEVQWRPTGTGQTRAWFVDVDASAATVTLDDLFGDNLSSTDWLLFAAADAGGDGRDDLFWWSLKQESNNPFGWLYEMDGTTLIGNTRLDPPDPSHFPDDPPGQLWKMVGVGDFDGDGSADISWRSAPAGLRRATLLDHGNLVRYERYPSNHTGAAAAIASGDLDGDSMTDLAFSDSVSTEPTLHRFLTPIRGVHFTPETFQDGIELRGTWTQRYNDSAVREQVREEMRAIRDLAEHPPLSHQGGLTHLWITLTPGRDFTWPVPTTSELDTAADILNDVHEIGLKAMISLPTWCQLSELQVDGAVNFDHVGGHCKNEMVNDNSLPWDCAPCIEDWPFNCGSTPPASPGTHLERVKNFYTVLVQGIESRLDAPDVVEYIVINGTPQLAFATETNLFWPGFPLKAQVAEFFQEVIPHVRSVTERWSVGVGLLPTHGTDPELIDYGFVGEWLDVMPMSDIDFIQITIPSFVDAQEMLDPPPGAPPEAGIAPEYRHKIVLTDFKAPLHAADGPLNPLTLGEVMTLSLEQVWAANARGWWLWTYKDYPGGPMHVGLREYSGTPGQTNQNDPSGWDFDALAVIAEDLGFR